MNGMLINGNVNNKFHGKKTEYCCTFRIRKGFGWERNAKKENMYIQALKP